MRWPCWGEIPRWERQENFAILCELVLIQTNIRQYPWVALAAALIVGEAVADLAVGGIALIHLAALAVALLIALLLLHGSKVAWVIAVLGALAQCVGAITGSQPVWAINSVLILIALVAPSSRRLVWVTKKAGGYRPAASVSRNIGSAATDVGYSWLARLAGWEDQFRNPVGEPRTYGTLLFRLFFLCIVLLGLVGVTTGWQEGSGRGSVIVAILSRAVWVAYVFIQLALIVVLCLEARSYLSRKRHHADL